MHSGPIASTHPLRAPTPASTHDADHPTSTVLIQLSYTFAGPAPPPLAPLRIRGDGESVQLTGVWPHRDLFAARRQLAAYFAALVPDTFVRCNFTGRIEPARALVEALTAPPTVASVFEARHAVADDHLIARLFGCYQLGESDVVVIADAIADVAEVYRFLTAWASFRLASLTAPPAEAARAGPRPAVSQPEPAWDRPFPWGYWLVSFADHDVADDDFWALCRDRLRASHLREAFDERMAAPAPKVVIEAADPADPDTAYVIGATRALALSSRQRQTAARLGATFATCPSAHDAAGYCDRVADGIGPETPLFAYREPARGALDSGWRFACLDPDHRHDADTLRIAPLSRAAAMPGLVDYLALSPGWVITREDGAFWLNAPGQAESHRDAGSAA